MMICDRFSEGHHLFFENYKNLCWWLMLWHILFLMDILWKFLIDLHKKYRPHTSILQNGLQRFSDNEFKRLWVDIEVSDFVAITHHSMVDGYSCMIWIIIYLIGAIASAKLRRNFDIVARSYSFLEGKYNTAQIIIGPLPNLRAAEGIPNHTLVVVFSLCIHVEISWTMRIKICKQCKYEYLTIETFDCHNNYCILP